MMREEEITYLESSEGQRAVMENIARNPLEIALDGRVAHAALIASQVKYLQRAQKKLPSFYRAACIVPQIAFEQSSSEAAAAMKRYSGRVCIDLTCGLGVDSLNFSKSFDRVIAVERDEALCRIARINFDRLGAKNIEVVNSTAEDFLDTFLRGERKTDLRGEQKADLIYIDPDRRPEVAGNLRRRGIAGGRRQLLLSDCTPDVVELMPRLMSTGRTVLIKTSPLFDVDEALRLFSEYGCGVEVVSAGGECKEVLIECGGKNSGLLGAAIAGGPRVSFPYHDTKNAATLITAAETTATSRDTRQTFSPPYDCLIIPDVAIRKARLTAACFSELFGGMAFIQQRDGYVFITADALAGKNITLTEIPGKVFEITSMRPYSPKSLRKELATRGVKSADIYLHDFPATADKICKELGMRQGGTAKLAFTRIGNELWVIEFENLEIWKCKNPAKLDFD